MIYVTHDQTEAMTLADKIVVLREGNIEQIGKPLDLYDDPGNQFVAGFVGSPKMNFIKGRVVESEGRTVAIELPGLSGARVEKQLAGTLPQTGSAVVVGIRPEHFADAGRGGTEISVRIDVAEHLGSTSYLYARTNEGEELVIERPTSREEADRETITVSIPQAKAYVFNGAGLRLR
jgi:lactose/L-arabinose transport system ATP-binding protein